METVASSVTATIVFIVLYFLVILTVFRLLINPDFKLPVKLQWMGKALEVPVFGPFIYWIYYFSTGRRKEKDNTPSK